MLHAPAQYQLPSRHSGHSVWSPHKCFSFIFKLERNIIRICNNKVVLMISICLYTKKQNTILLFYGKGGQPIEVTRPEPAVVMMWPWLQRVTWFPQKRQSPDPGQSSLTQSTSLWPASSTHVPTSSQKFFTTSHFYPARSLTPQFIPAFLVPKGVSGLLASHLPWAATTHTCSQVSF